jgi:hypothetical protein
MRRRRHAPTDPARVPRVARAPAARPHAGPPPPGVDRGAPRRCRARVPRRHQVKCRGVRMPVVQGPSQPRPAALLLQRAVGSGRVQQHGPSCQVQRRSAARPTRSSPRRHPVRPAADARLSQPAPTCRRSWARRPDARRNSQPSPYAVGDRDLATPTVERCSRTTQPRQKRIRGARPSPPWRRAEAQSSWHVASLPAFPIHSQFPMGNGPMQATYAVCAVLRSR